MSRYRDPQLQVGENYWYLFNLRQNMCKSWCTNKHFISNNSDLICLLNELKTTTVVFSALWVSIVYGSATRVTPPPHPPSTHKYLSIFIHLGEIKVNENVEIVILKLGYFFICIVIPIQCARNSEWILIWLTLRYLWLVKVITLKFVL